MSSNSALIDQNKSYTKLIWVVSIIIPIAVAVLIYLPSKLNITSDWVKILPHLNGFLNSLTSILLILAVVFVKQGKIEIHKKMMSASFILGAVFLVSYIIYHATTESVKYGDLNGNGILEETELAQVGASRGIYLFVLLSHILLAIAVVPFVLFAFYFALSNKIEKHKKIVKFTFPIWLYVSVTGVIVYLMISAYY